MTRTKQILKLLTDGKSRTKQELMQEVGADDEQLRKALWQLELEGSIEGSPRVYAITERGRRKSAQVPKTPQKVMDRKVAHRRMKRLAAKVQEGEANHFRIGNIPNSVWALGSPQ